MPTTRPAHHRLFRTLGGGLAVMAALTGCAIWAAEPAATLPRFSPHLAVYQGPINVGIVIDGRRALLIDCGDASVAARLPELGVKAVDRILFTHHHRDQACGAYEFVAAGAKLFAPAAERTFFDDVAAYWSNPKTRWHIYNVHPHHLMLAESVPVAGVTTANETIAWGPARITVLSTPGHTDGGVSYLIEVDGRRVVFCGDAIYDAGQFWELHSLQKGSTTTDYHGFLGARKQLAESLGRIKSAARDAIVPSHGRIMKAPGSAVDALLARLDACYDKYASISALRHYFPKMFTEYADRKDHMPIGPGLPVPDCLRHFGTTWILLAQDRSALVMDCGSEKALKAVQEMVNKGEIRAVEGLWVTHYHDDHVDKIPEFQKTFTCPCITDRAVADVITRPLAWRLPCISPSVARVDRPTRDGESWNWHEFRLTAYHLPGQTLYHAGLFVEGQGKRMLFVGDSFTMAGIDDYSAQNRCWLGRGVGFDRCVALIEKLRPTHIFNCHVNDAFQFTPEQCRFMRQNLTERERLFGQLLAWDHPNYGMDDSWVRADPYEQEAAAGGEAAVDLVVTNHSTAPRNAICRAVLPRSWKAAGAAFNASATITAKQEGRLALRLPIPAGVGPGRYVIPFDVNYADRRLPQFTEAIVVVKGSK